MNAEQLAALAGIALSLAFSYVPGLSDKWANLDGVYKRLVMAGLIVLVGAGAFGLSCAAVITALTCDKAGAESLLWPIVNALIANQAAFSITPSKQALREAWARLKARYAG